MVRAALVVLGMLVVGCGGYDVEVTEVAYAVRAIDEDAPRFEVWVASDGERARIGAIDDDRDGTLLVAHEPVPVGEDVYLMAWRLPAGLDDCTDPNDPDELAADPETGAVYCSVVATCDVTIRGPGKLPCLAFVAFAE